MAHFDVNKWNKQRYLAEAGEEIQGSVSKAIADAIPEDYGIEDLAKDISYILKTYYGPEGNKYNKFMDIVHNDLGMIPVNEEKSYDTYTVNITTSDPKEGGPDEDFTEKVKVDSSLIGDDIKASIKDTLYDMGYNRLYKLTYEKA